MEINKQDVDIAQRDPSRQATAGPRPVICKFTRRIDKEGVISRRKEACKFLQHRLVSNSIFLWEMSRFSIITLHRPRNYSPMPRIFKVEMDSGSVGQKTLLSIYESLRTLAPSGSKARKTLNDLHAERTYL